MRENLQRLISEYQFETWEIAAITGIRKELVVDYLMGIVIDLLSAKEDEHRVAMLLASCDRIRDSGLARSN